MTHTHEIKYWPHTSDGCGYATCECGATIRIEHGIPKWSWHACEKCVYGYEKHKQVPA